MSQLEWDYTDEIRLDDSIMFGLGYDFSGLEGLRREATGPNGNYLMWSSGGKWSLYRDTDGVLAFERYCSREECEQAAQLWCADILSASARNGEMVMVGDQVIIVNGLATGDIGTLVGIIQPTLSHVPTYMVKFSDCEHPQAYFSWEISQNDKSSPENGKSKDVT